MLREELDNLGFHVEGMRQTRAQSAEGLKEGIELYCTPFTIKI
jgi:hypothetical protein